MGYSNFRSLKVVTKKFGLKTERVNLFDSIVPITPSDWLKTTVEYAYMIPLSNEKVKSERLISPILTEVHRLHQDKLSLFSGEELNVDSENDLNGACDFFFSAVSGAYLLEAPIVTIIDVKKKN